jgi:hypothetical protein
MLVTIPAVVNLLCRLSLNGLIGLKAAEILGDSLRGRIWKHVLGGRNGVKPCASPAGMLTECAAEGLTWSIFSAKTMSTFVS